MIVETANSLMMLGRHLSNNGGVEHASSSTVVPIKKRKWEKRASFEASTARGSLEMSRARQNFVHRKSKELPGRRPSFEFRSSFDTRPSLDLAARAIEEEPHTSAFGEADDSDNMRTIQENSDD